MRVLLIMIAALCFGIAGLAVSSTVAVRSERVDMRAELSRSIATAQPPVDELLTNHANRIGRFEKHWNLVGVLSTISAFAALMGFGFTLRKRRHAEV